MKTHGIVYDLTHVPVYRMSVLRKIISLAIKLKLKIHQMYFTTAFLNAALEDEMVTR